ncbi:RNA-directed DNA polymerase from mobile element jockey [Eumeta japonica]|uniref:RNA-directed DNA polymerase from mobile element jockey n=1 Tax=Eumeta variegata TaxID=151549 RepID=A0A4C1TKI2_EUMVA|nr:RNA-directed DNA polymerase from mobile element jockey [Eumeta japonica]
MRRYAVKDRAEILAEHSEEQFTPHPASDSREATSHQEGVERYVREFLSAPVPSLPGNYYVSPVETGRAILRLPKQYGPGPDGIPTVAIKQLPRRAMVAMTRLFNGILRTRHFPECWKMGRVIAIPKKGKDHRLASSKRSFTLLSHITKLFEHIMLRRLHRHLTPRQERKHPDLASARADSSVVPGEQLLRNSRGRPRIRDPSAPGYHKTVAYRRACTRYSQMTSPLSQANYKDDVLALYSDDIAYLVSSRRADLAIAKLHTVLDLLPDWLNKWRMAMNVTKTTALLTGQQRIMPPKLRLRRQEVEWQTRVRYQGVHIDRSMCMAAQAC